MLDSGCFLFVCEFAGMSFDFFNSKFKIISINLYYSGK